MGMRMGMEEMGMEMGIEGTRMDVERRKEDRRTSGHELPVPSVQNAGQIPTHPLESAI